MRRRGLILRTLIVLATPIWSAASVTAHGGAPANSPSDAPRESALVTIAGPSVYRQFAAMTDTIGTSPRADQVVARAADLSVELAAAEADVHRGQQPVIAAAERLGVRVVSRYTTAANGLLVHATAGQLEALQHIPGVEWVEPAPILRPTLEYSVPHIGGTRLASELGYDGEGSVVAVIDTGVDYTHAHLGGPGTVEAWAAASAVGATETITDTWEGEPLFPNGKVIGGWDFVGRNYDPPHVCTPAREAAGDCTSTPHPDADPLDGHGHGTHVSGIVAGNAIPNIGDGVAPGAKIVGLKVYGHGGADEAADVVVDAIEWCARVNTGLETRGVLPPQVDAINISLGEDHAQGSRLFDEAVEAAVGTGVVVVASAGNSGNRPFVAGAPAASPKILSVASALPPSAGIEVEVRWEDEQAEHFGIEGGITRPLSETGAIEAELGWFGRGCNDDEVLQDVNELIALVERGSCNFSQKILNAQEAGAIAVLMFTNSRGKTRMGGSSDGIEIPAVMIDRQPGLDLVKLLEDGTVVTAVLDPERFGLDMSRADSVSGFSSRGPSKNGALKPDITAPGNGIVSAARGTGDQGVPMGGTSMAGPHIAGAAALVHHRNRTEDLGLGAGDLAALLMNYARPIVFQGSGAGKTLVPVVRQGAGQVDLWGAGSGRLLVRTGELASINLGPVSLTGPEHQVRSLTVRNLTHEPVTFAVDAAFLYEEDSAQGLEIQTPDEPVTLVGAAETTVNVTFTLDPDAMRPWTLRPAAGAVAGPVDTLEIDGYVTFTPVDSQGDPLPDVPVPSVPFYVLPRRASAIESRGLPAMGTGEDALQFLNRSPFDGSVELFVAPIDGRTGADARDPDEDNVTHELDIRRVGVRIEPPTEVVTHTMLTFGLARHQTAAIPQATRYEVYIDTDRDGAPDYRVREGARRDQMLTYFGKWDAAAGAIDGAEFITGTVHATDLHTHLTILSVPAATVGMTETVPFDFYVISRGLNEDWLHTARSDVAPDGAAEDGGPRYHAEPALMGSLPEAWSIAVSGGESVNVVLQRRQGGHDATLLAFYPDNRFEGADGQLEVLVPGRVVRIFMPSVLSPLK